MKNDKEKDLARVDGPCVGVQGELPQRATGPSESCFTAGPWHVGPHYKSDVESREGRICECRPLQSPRAIANAQLISAAPSLLEACRDLVDRFDRRATSKASLSCSYVEAKLAIAKAEGRA